MSERRVWLDQGVGETRAVVTLDGLPERLIIERDGDPVGQGLGARSVARIRSVERGQALAFLDLGEGPDAVINVGPEMGRIESGRWAEIEIRAQARTGKGAQARWLGPAEGPARILSPGPALEERLAALAPGARVETGSAARAMADAAQDEALETVFPLPGGGTVCVETTRALAAVDVDIGQRPGSTAKRVARAANLAALATAARILRLKGLGGLVAIDLAGRGHDAPALLAAARTAFAPDNPGVAFSPVSRFGVLELTIPRRARPALDVLLGCGRTPTHMTIAMSLIRALEREALIDGGGRFEAVTSPATMQAAAPVLKQLTGRLGERLTIRAEPGLASFEIRRR